MKWPLVALATLATSLATGLAQAQTAPSLDCTAPFTRETDEAEFVKAFGRANVVAADIETADGAKERGTVLFPNDPARRIEISWRDAEKRQNPAAIVIRDKSRWTVRTADRKTVGVNAPLDQVEQANGRPFSVAGAAATGWRGGAFETFPGGCTISIHFTSGAPAAAQKKANVDQTLGSNDAALRAAKLRVSTISISWAQ